MALATQIARYNLVAVYSFNVDFGMKSMVFKVQRGVAAGYGLHGINLCATVARLCRQRAGSVVTVRFPTVYTLSCCLAIPPLSG